MAKLILVRHGQTDWNARGRFQGQSNPPLNELGQQQAAMVGRRLAGQKILSVLSSDLQRAWQTAEIIAASRGLDMHVVHPEPRLREMDFGDWEGLTYAEIGRRFPHALEAWQQDPSDVAPPGGESLAQLAARVQSVYNDLGNAQSETVLLVAHGGSLQVLLCVAFGLRPGRHWQFRLDPASLSELYVYPEGPILTLLNDTSHLMDDAEEIEWES